MSIVSKIPDLDDNELNRLFHNAMDLINQNKRVEDAEEVLEVLQEEWANRLERYTQGQYRATTPDTGMLKSLNYRVGLDGLKKDLRRQILDFIIEGVLPPVGSPAYVAEWGKPLSRQRYRKLHRVIRVLASSAETLGNMEKAAMEWIEDLDYLEEKWRSVCQE